MAGRSDLDKDLINTKSPRLARLATGIENTDPERAKPQSGAESSSLESPRRGIDEPRWRMSRAGDTRPKRAALRGVGEDSRVADATTEGEEMLPERDNPGKDAKLSSRAGVCADMKDPELRESVANTTESGLLKLRRSDGKSS